MMKMIAADDHVDRGMHFNASDLRARKVLLVVDVMDVIILNQREYTAQMTDDAGLAAVVNVAAAHDM